MKRLAAGLIAATLIMTACGSDDDASSTTEQDDDGRDPDGADSGVPDDDCVTSVAERGSDSESDDLDIPEPTIDGVERFAGLTHGHVEDCVEYVPNPPVGGDHWGVWQACGFYGDPVPPERAVHSMEHGAVWITYSPDLDAAARDALSVYAGEFVLVSPWNRDPLPSPVVASAWGLQLEVETVDDPRLGEFVNIYANGPQNREPGAPCVEGGTDETA